MRRRQLSPSPEVDLSSPEFDDDDEPPSPNGSSVSGLPRSNRSSISHPTPPHNPTNFGRRNALSSPPLEGDEQEFTQSAIMLKQRSASREYEEQQLKLREAQQQSLKRARDQMGSDENENPIHSQVSSSSSPDEERHIDGRDSEVAAALSLTTAAVSDGLAYRSIWVEGVQSPESVELDELDDLLGEGFE